MSSVAPLAWHRELSGGQPAYGGQDLGERRLLRHDRLRAVVQAPAPLGPIAGAGHDEDVDAGRREGGDEVGTADARCPGRDR